MNENSKRSSGLPIQINFKTFVLIIYLTIEILTNWLDIDVLGPTYVNRKFSCYIWTMRRHNQYVCNANLKMNRESKLIIFAAIIIL